MVLTEDQIWEYLEDVRDPEIPVINIVELGVLRKVTLEEDSVTVSITPTYSGCPAMKVMEEDIIAKLHAEGISKVEVKKVYSPAWTTDDILPAGREKMKAYGIAPPLATNPKLHFLANDERTVPCPRCSSVNTTMKSAFGSTSCKALHYCNDCQEPFDYFKCL